jgi:hypothetical protein
MHIGERAKALSPRHLNHEIRNDVINEAHLSMVGTHCTDADDQSKRARNDMACDLVSRSPACSITSDLSRWPRWQKYNIVVQVSDNVPRMKAIIGVCITSLGTAHLDALLQRMERESHGVERTPYE